MFWWYDNVIIWWYGDMVWPGSHLEKTLFGVSLWGRFGLCMYNANTYYQDDRMERQIISWVWRAAAFSIVFCSEITFGVMYFTFPASCVIMIMSVCAVRRAYFFYTSNPHLSNWIIPCSYTLLSLEPSHPSHPIQASNTLAGHQVVWSVSGSMSLTQSPSPSPAQAFFHSIHSMQSGPDLDLDAITSIRSGLSPYRYIYGYIHE